jgi:hypothetical protein
MALHNWYFGGAFVPFSANVELPQVVPMPPQAYAAAFGELLRLDFSGEHLRRGAWQIGRWLSGPSDSLLLVPLHVVAVAALVRVAFARAYDPWLRLIAGAALALHPVAWFFLYSERYHYLAWLLTLLVASVWMRDEGAGLLRRVLPGVTDWFARHRLTACFGRALDRWVALAGPAGKAG